MGDSHPNSLVFCHEDDAQIQKLPGKAVPERFWRALWGGDEKAGEVLIYRQLYIAVEGGGGTPNSTFRQWHVSRVISHRPARD